MFANFTIGMIGIETGHKLECVKLYGKFIVKSEMRKHGCYFAEYFMGKNLIS